MSIEPNSIRLDRENGRCLGVCAGIANWLEVPASLVRIVFIICVISWPPLLIGYFILYFCLDKDITPEKMQEYFSNGKTADHFRQLDYRKPIYRNERDRKIGGVCAGIADYLEVSTFMVRLITLGSLFIFGPYTIGAYILCYFVFDADPYTKDDARRDLREQRRQRKAARREARHTRRAMRRKTRKSYANKDIEAEVVNAVRGFEEELEQDIEDVVNGMDKSKRRRSRAEDRATPRPSRAQVTSLYSELETRLREIEAFMTSKRFRLHCQINRI